jgi:DUF4097 and DUF4098 domain-containing protein YvlB
MFRKVFVFLVVAGCVALPVSVAADSDTERGTREFSVSAGGELILDLEAGANVKIAGTGGSMVSVNYSMDCSPKCKIRFDETAGGLKIRVDFVKSDGHGKHGKHGGSRNSDVRLDIQVPSRFDVDLESMGGAFSIDGVDGRFTGSTMGGGLTLHDVRGEARLKTMGGKIKLTDSELDGRLETMGGEVLFENVVGDIKGKSMGGNVRYKNVRLRDGRPHSPVRVGYDLDEVNHETVQISTMGGEIRIEDAFEGADLHTMGGDIVIRNAAEFVRAKTMGGDIEVESIDGWIDAMTMGGNVEVTVTGSGGDVTLTSMSGDIDLTVPSGFGMDLDLEIAFTRNSNQKFEIDAPGGLPHTVSPDWDYGKGSPRKYIRMSGAVNGGGNKVKVRTVNGNIRLK